MSSPNSSPEEAHEVDEEESAGVSVCVGGGGGLTGQATERGRRGKRKVAAGGAKPSAGVLRIKFIYR